MSKVQLVTKFLHADFHPYKFRSCLCTSSLLCRYHNMARCRALTTPVGLIGPRLNYHTRAVKWGTLAFRHEFHAGIVQYTLSFDVNLPETGSRSQH